MNLTPVQGLQHENVLVNTCSMHVLCKQDPVSLFGVPCPQKLPLIG